MRRLFVILTAAFSLASGAVFGQAAWPAKPVRWIVPFPPGGSADVISRVVAQKLAERIGQPVIVENRSGASGNVGHEAVARAAPDGHTVLFVVPGIVTNPFFFRASVDPFKELAPVIQLDTVPMVLLANAAFPGKTLAEVLAHIRGTPGAVTCAVSSAIPMVGCALLRSHARTDMLLVQYKGQAPAMNALMSGEINLMFEVMSLAAGQVKSGRVRAIASTSTKRGSGPFPDLALASDTVPEFELVTWHGVMVPRATPREIVLRINRELGAVLEQPDVRQRFVDGGFELAGGTPEAFDELLKREYAKYEKVLREAGVKPE
jgi:tripartite-type tricarboxylate transporter receptor subunit TctC